MFTSKRQKDWTLHFSFSCTHSHTQMRLMKMNVGGTVLLTSCVSNCGPVLQGHGGKDKQGEDRNRSDEEKLWNTHSTWRRVCLTQSQSRLLALGEGNCMWWDVKAVTAEREMTENRRKTKGREGGDTSREEGGRRRRRVTTSSVIQNSEQTEDTS